MAGRLLLIRGQAMLDGDEGTVVKLRANSVEKLAEARAKRAHRFEMEVPVFALDDKKLTRLREILTEHLGTVPARLTITYPQRFETVIALPETMKVNPTDELLQRVDGLFGARIVRLG